ncbi:NAD(P)-binding protein [Aspergillus karnatakaensis]|uniref:Gfo/Idh/MocA family protein n=1 Tax=Aspergillus karnatakaensis TaxID=1810916 RepID=UPI003CCCF72E
MSSLPIHIIIIGAGLIGPRHAQSVLTNPATTLLAFIDPSPSAAPQASQFNVPLYPSLQSLLADSKANRIPYPDAAIVCTPNHTHVAIANQLLENSIHILLEKPVSDSLESAANLLKSLNSPSTRSKNLKILVGHHRRFNPYALTTKSLLSQNKLGTVIAVSGLWTTQKPDSYFAPPIGSWRAEKSSGGVLGINLIHDVDLLMFFLGPITRVYAEGTAPQRVEQNPRHTAEEGAAITFRFASGVVGTFLISDVVPSPLNFETGTRENPRLPGVNPEESASDCYRIFGTGGSLSVPDLTRWSYEGKEVMGWEGEIGVEKVPVLGAGVKPFDAQLEHFVRVVRGEEEVECSVGDGVRALRVVRGVRESLESGRAVEIEVGDA